MRMAVVWPGVVAVLIALTTASADAQTAMGHAGDRSQQGAAGRQRLFSSAPRFAFRLHERHDFDRFGFFPGNSVVATGPAEIVSLTPPNIVINAVSERRPIPAADLPPCQETTSSGVVVVRGMSCSRTTH